MPGSLTPYLQQRFTELCPKGYTCTPEASVLDDALARLLGYHPRADVRLDHEASGRRIWIEFEISRADTSKRT